MSYQKKGIAVLLFKYAALLTLLILNVSITSRGLEDDIRFRRISIDEGLSQSSVICILQDKKGFMWFGTQDGLNRYDGHSFAIYKHIPGDSNSLSGNHVYSLYEDRSGALWVGTWAGGLNRFDCATMQFTRYKNDPEDLTSLSDNHIRSIYKDHLGILWVGTEGGGINQFDKATNRYIRYTNDPKDSRSLSHNSVLAICEDRSGTLWIGTEGGLNRFDRGTKHFTRYQNDPDDPYSLSSSRIYSIYEDRSGTLWIGTWGGGLNRFDRSKERFIHYQNDLENPHSLSDNRIYSIYEDHLGVLWIGTEGGGLNRFDRASGRFICYTNDPRNPNSLSHNTVWSIYEDRSNLLWIGTMSGLNLFDRIRGNFVHFKNDPDDLYSLKVNDIRSIFEDHLGILWIGTWGGGINKLDRSSGRFSILKNDPDDPYSLSDNRVYSIYEDHLGGLWVGTWENGLNQFDRATERFIRYINDPDDPHSLSDNHIRAIYEDHLGVLWIGTEGGGLNRFDRATKRFFRYINDPDDPHSLSNNDVRSIYEDRSGTLWIGTRIGGLNRFDRATERFIRYMNDPDDPYSLSDNRIFSIYEDRTGVLWIGTRGGGLNRFDRNTKRFKSYTEKEGLPNNVIYSILEDKKGNLWLSTNRGLSKFNPKAQKFKNYDVTDGLQSNEFNFGAFHKNQSGEMFFGGINGFNAFYPERIRDNPYVPPIVITDFQIFNKPVPIGEMESGRSILKETITETEEIVLSHRDRSFSFEFTALNYISPEKNEFAYMMEGFEEDWNYVGNRRFVTYSALPPGNYVFRVKGSNNDGIWNEEGTSLKITVVPPFWQTGWFVLLAILVGMTLVYGGHRYRVRLLQIRTKILEKKVKNRTTDLTMVNKQLKQEIVERKKAEVQLHASLREKDVLLKEIHHRVKNNMQVISSLINLQARSLKDKYVLEMFRKCQERIRTMALIHEKLYGSRDLARINFAQYIQSLSISLLSSYKVNTDLVTLKTDLEDVLLDVNTAIPCGLIVNELVSNALKHAFPDRRKKEGKIRAIGEVIIRLRSNEKRQCMLVVQDNGVGFPKDLEPQKTESLGMQLVNDLVHQINGKIEMQRNKGTVFKITFNAPK